MAEEVYGILANPIFEVLLKEAGYAIQFYEKCLFYSPNGTVGFGDNLYSYSDFKGKVEALEGKLNENSELEMLGTGFLVEICLRYAQALNMLAAQFADTLDKYGKKTITVGFIKVAYTLLEGESAGTIAFEVVSRSNELLLSICASLAAPIALESIHQIPANEWEIIRTCGNTCIEQLSFLAERINNSHQLLLGAAGILAACFFSLLSLWISFQAEYLDADKSHEETVNNIYREMRRINEVRPMPPGGISNQGNSKFQLNFGSNNKISLNLHPVSLPSNTTELAPALSDLSKEMGNLSTAIADAAKGISASLEFQNRVAKLEGEMGILTKQVAALQTLGAGDVILHDRDLHDISARFDKLHSEIRELSVLKGKSSPPPIYLNKEINFFKVDRKAK